MSNKKEVVGIEVVNYTNKQGRQISGVRIHCIEPLPAPHLGSRTISEFITGQGISDFTLGEYSALLYEPGFGNTHRCVGVLYSNK